MIGMRDIEVYLQTLEDRRLSPRTVAGRRWLLEQVSRNRVPWTQAALTTWLRKRQLADATEGRYRMWLNQFLRWRGSAEHLPTVKVRRKLLSPTDLVTPEEVRQLISAADHPRDRALIATLYETAGRAHEVLGIRRQDIEFGQQLTRIRLDGKTGPRIVPVVECAPYLQAWLEYTGPLTPEDGIWRGPHGPIVYSTLRELLAKLSLRVLGRRIPCHRFRHSRASHLAAHPAFNEALIAKFGGWTVGSPILATYVHLAGRDLDPAVLALHGRHELAPSAPSVLTPKACARCHHENPADATYCSQCSLILDPAEAQRILLRDQDVFSFVAWLVAHPDEVAKLRAKMQAEPPR
jgi:integrase/recombinase XerD